jgi:hypothetical protein
MASLLSYSRALECQSDTPVISRSQAFERIWKLSQIAQSIYRDQNAVKRLDKIDGVKTKDPYNLMLASRLATVYFGIPEKEFQVVSSYGTCIEFTGFQIEVMPTLANLPLETQIQIYYDVE